MDSGYFAQWLLKSTLRKCLSWYSPVNNPSRFPRRHLVIYLRELHFQGQSALFPETGQSSGRSLPRCSYQWLAKKLVGSHGLVFFVFNWSLVNHKYHMEWHSLSSSGHWYISQSHWSMYSCASWVEDGVLWYRDRWTPHVSSLILMILRIIKRKCSLALNTDPTLNGDSQWMHKLKILKYYYSIIISCTKYHKIFPLIFPFIFLRSRSIYKQSNISFILPFIFLHSRSIDKQFIALQLHLRILSSSMTSSGLTWLHKFHAKQFIWKHLFKTGPWSTSKWFIVHKITVKTLKKT